MVCLFTKKKLILHWFNIQVNFNKKEMNSKQCVHKNVSILNLKNQFKVDSYLNCLTKLSTNILGIVWLG